MSLKPGQLTLRHWNCLMNAVSSLEAVVQVVRAEGKVEPCMAAIEREHCEIGPLIDRVRGNRSLDVPPTWGDAKLLLAGFLHHFLEKLEKPL